MVEQAQAFEAQHLGEDGFVDVAVGGLGSIFMADKIKMHIDWVIIRL